jgi:hypothetical protein
MRKVISYSLWGDKAIYNHGFVHNYFDAKKIYPEWDVVIYHDDSIDDFVKDIILENNIISYNMTGSDIKGEFWRFLANDLDGVEYTIFRDCDSRLSNREKLAVDEWVNSGLTLHVMRDHPYHKIPLGISDLGMLAGMWGIKNGKINMSVMINEFIKSNNYKWGDDQKFIYDIYNNFLDDKICHDEFFDGIKFPIKRVNQHFIGERIDENNNRVGDDYKLIR